MITQELSLKNRKTSPEFSCVTNSFQLLILCGAIKIACKISILPTKTHHFHAPYIAGESGRREGRIGRRILPHRPVKYETRRHTDNASSGMLVHSFSYRVDAKNSPFILQRALYESMVENPLFCMCRWSIFSSVDGWILITNWRKILPFLGEYSPTCRHMRRHLFGSTRRSEINPPSAK
jgi:hypothetical protein